MDAFSFLTISSVASMLGLGIFLAWATRGKGLLERFAAVVIPGVAILFVLLTGWHHLSATFMSRGCPPYLEDQALDAVSNDLGFHGRLPGSATDAELLKASKRIEDLRLWVGRQADRCVRAAYATWLDHFEREVIDTREQRARRLPPPPGAAK
jgi:hypothetical protein